MKLFIKLRTFNTIAAIGSSAAILYFLLSVTDTIEIKQKFVDPNNTKPDFYLNKINSRSFNPQGDVEFTIVSQSLIHNPINNNSLLFYPDVEIYDQGQRAWTANSKSATVNSAEKKIELRENVIFLSQDQSSKFETSLLTILTDKNIAKTTEAVSLISPEGLIQAGGAYINMQSREIIMTGQIRGRFNVSP